MKIILYIYTINVYIYVIYTINVYIYVSEYVRPSLKKYWFTLYEVDRYM